MPTPLASATFPAPAAGEFTHLAPVTLPDAVRNRAEGVAAILVGLQLDALLARAGYAVPLAAAGVWAAETLDLRIGSEAARLAQEVLALPAVESISEQTGLPPSPEQAENLRKLLLAVIRDARVLVIRLAERLYDLRTAKKAPPADQRALARATREIYAPLASRLGMWQLKWELEDLAFRYLQPEHYRQVAGWLRERRTDREAFIAQVSATLERKLQEANVAASVAGRPKHLYSIWRKLQRKQLQFSELCDIRAVRVLVDTPADCYAALGMVHNLWHPIPKEFDDYIGAPKDNLYRSLHTAVIGPDNRPMEIQIRTHEMHRHAEWGVAAHWRYKEGGRFDAGLETRLGWLRQLLSPDDSDADFIDRFRSELVDERVYVLTPKGEVVDLPCGATPLDFAYYIHTDLGHRCRGARVNGRLVVLTRILESGDQVDILAGRVREPSRDWLNPLTGLLATSRARDKVRAFFRAQDRQQNIRHGHEALERELERLGLREFRPERLLRQFSFPTLDELFAAMGAGDVSAAQIAGALQRELAARTPAVASPASMAKQRRPHKSPAPAIAVADVSNLLTSLARCCHPLPGDTVRGYVTRGRGISVHRTDCAGLKRLLTRSPDREIAVAWQRGEQGYPVEVAIEARERRGLLAELTAAIAHEKIRILATQTQLAADSGLALIRLTLTVTDLCDLTRLLARLARIAGVLRASRYMRA